MHIYHLAGLIVLISVFISPIVKTEIICGPWIKLWKAIQTINWRRWKVDNLSQYLKKWPEKRIRGDHNWRSEPKWSRGRGWSWSSNCTNWNCVCRRSPPPGCNQSVNKVACCQHNPADHWYLSWHGSGPEVVSQWLLGLRRLCLWWDRHQLPVHQPRLVEDGVFRAKEVELDLPRAPALAPVEGLPGSGLTEN